MCSHSLPASHRVMQRGHPGLNKVSFFKNQPHSFPYSGPLLVMLCLRLWLVAVSLLQSLTNILFPVSLSMKNHSETLTKHCLLTQLLSSATLNVRSPLSLGFRGSSTSL